MKKIIAFLSVAVISLTAFAQTWTQKANFPGANRYYDCGFSIGHCGYIGCGIDGGINYYNDFYRWDQNTNTWSAIANYPGAGRISPVAFSIEGKGYVGLGSSISARQTDLWSYDSATNTWTQMASLPGPARYDEVAFVLGHKAWIITGSTGGPPYLNDIWMYDAHQNTWTQMNNSPGGNLSGMAAFAIGNHGYIGGGWDGSAEHSQFWQYDSALDSWTPIANIPFANGCSGNPRTFVINNIAYVCNGTTNVYNTLPVGYSYDPNTNTWTEFTNMGAVGIERGYAAAFTIGNYGYIGTGKDSLGHFLNSYWEWHPVISNPPCNVWTQKADLPGASRWYATGFSAGHCGYIGCGSDGSNNYNDFYRWDQTNNTWSAIASYPGAGYFYSPIGFTIEGKGYVGLGWGGSGSNDLWSYDSALNTWTQMASLPGPGRYDEAVFVLGHKAWIITGSQGGPPYLNDIWMYDAHTNTWTQMNNSPGGQLSGMVAFTVGGHGYIGGGWDGGLEHSQFWQYDSALDSWTPIASIPFVNGCSGDPRTFVIGNTAYVCTGTTNTYNTLPIGYAYDPNSNTWSEFTNMGAVGIERGYSVAFSIGGYGYIGTGQDSAGNYLNTFWQYYPCSDSLILTDGNNEPEVNFAGVKLYPNPNNGIIHIEYANLTSEKSQIEITDITGRNVGNYEIEGKSGKLTISETMLADNLYFYRVLSDGKIISTGKFVISR